MFIRCSRGLRRFSTAAAKYDLVVIGGGPGGYIASIKAGQLGMKVACVESRGALGGTCLNVGCIPSKALLNASHKYHDAKTQFSKFGVEVKDVVMNVANMQKQKRSAVSALTGGVELLFKKNKVAYVKGFGTITGPNEVSVQPLDKSATQVLKADKILVATGSEPASLPNVPVDEKRIVTSTGALDLQKVPKSMVVIGAGVIGLEMGSVWSRLGSQITVVDFLDRILPGTDSEIATSFQRILQRQKFKFILGQKIMSATNLDNGLTEVRMSPVKGGAEQKLTAEVVLVATGRRPFTKGLGLDRVNIQMDKAGRVITNDHFQTSIPSIYAIGDVIKGPMLAHKAEDEGVACVELMCGKGGHVNYDVIPGVVYTHPEVATIGKSEDELKAAKVKYKVGKFPFAANSRARTIDDFDGFVKFVADRETDKVLGVHIIGAGAGEMIAEAALAMEYGASCEDIARTCHAHPTVSEAFREAAMDCMDGFPLNAVPKGKITP